MEQGAVLHCVTQPPRGVVVLPACMALQMALSCVLAGPLLRIGKLLVVLASIICTHCAPRGSLHTSFVTPQPSNRI